jgi:hypothetical protein
LDFHGQPSASKFFFNWNVHCGEKTAHYTLKPKITGKPTIIEALVHWQCVLIFRSLSVVWGTTKQNVTREKLD